MSIMRIARYLKINHSLHGVQSDDERRMVLPVMGGNGRTPMFMGLLDGGKCDARSRGVEVQGGR